MACLLQLMQQEAPASWISFASGGCTGAAAAAGLWTPPTQVGTAGIAVLQVVNLGIDALNMAYFGA